MMQLINLQTISLIYLDSSSALSASTSRRERSKKGASMARLTTCKTCGREISARAKTCPHCGEHRRGGLLEGVLKGVGVVVGGLVLLSLVLPESDTEPRLASSESLATTAYRIGDAVEAGGFVTTIKQVRSRASVGADLFAARPGDGGVFVVVDFSYVNAGAKPVPSFRAPEAKLRDRSGAEYRPDLGATASYATERDLSGKGFSDINPGVRIVDAAVFEVSAGAYDAGGWRVFVELGRDGFEVAID